MNNREIDWVSSPDWRWLILLVCWWVGEMRLVELRGLMIIDTRWGLRVEVGCAMAALGRYKTTLDRRLLKL
jgi:hypothetical protein